MQPAISKSESGKLVREAILSTLVGTAVVLLMFVNRPESLGWRVLLYGGLAGLCIFLACRALFFAAQPLHRSGRIPRGVVATVTFFFGGVLGWAAATILARIFSLIQFDLSARDLMIALALTGGLAVGMGLVFYSFGRMEDRLRESVARLKEAEFAEKELELARELQSCLLPPQSIEGDGFAIQARNLPARYVAGDFYDVFRLPDGQVGLVVADVSGKGVGASLTMASVKGVLPLLAAGRSVAGTLNELNRKLARELPSREFVALLYARFDPNDGRLELANAGLPDPYRLRAGALPEPLSTPDPRFPLGSRAAVQYESLEVALAPGDRVLFLTDGLPEALKPDGSPLGYEALREILSDSSGESGEWIDRLLERVRRASSPSLDDDWTVLLLENRARDLAKSPLLRQTV